MHKPQEQVVEFHRAMNVPISSGSPEIRRPELRAALILEEALETVIAILGTKRAIEKIRSEVDKIEREATSADGRSMFYNEPDLVEAIDGMCDVLVVTYGTAVDFGVDLEPFYDEVHRSNMAKAGGKRREDGKVLKPEGWQPPRIKELLDEIYSKR